LLIFATNSYTADSLTYQVVSDNTKDITSHR